MNRVQLWGVMQGPIHRPKLNNPPKPRNRLTKEQAKATARWQLEVLFQVEKAEEDGVTVGLKELMREHGARMVRHLVEECQWLVVEATPTGPNTRKLTVTIDEEGRCELADHRWEAIKQTQENLTWPHNWR